jgi:dipeptidyl aminopeptidase/acylaminoacyl peptidase
MLTAFSHDSQESGFFSKRIDEKGDPLLLTMGPYNYQIIAVADVDSARSGGTSAYLVSRESVSDSRNLLVTTNFKTFAAVSDVHPERNYNWLTAELMKWTLPDGSSNLGVLYKPENFDPTKKYPVIFYYYEILSNELYKYKVPAPASGRMDIPTFVSNGYLVFTPDIHYKVGHPMMSAVDAVDSAAEYLATKPWADGSKFGLQGISFGGIETNYIVAHSHLFAAANAASGIADFDSGYDSIAGNGSSLQVMYEWTQMRIGATLWQRPDLYLENSAVMHADDVTTPLLIMHTDKDGVCLFPQAVEFFTALRRLGKKVWMLEYEDYDHGLPDESPAAADFTIRLSQFFDYYLKGALPPRWMTVGIPARLKRIDAGLDLDATGQNP